MEHTQIKTAGKERFGVPQAVGLGVIVFLVVAGVWTAFQLGPYLPDTLRRFAGALVTMSQTFTPSEKLSLYANSNNIHSGEEIVVSWTHRNHNSAGVYSFSYPCIDHVYLGVKTVSGDRLLLCDMKSEIQSENNTLTVIAVSENEGVSEVPLTLFYTKMENTGSPLSASVTVSIIGEKKDATFETQPSTPKSQMVTPPVAASPVKKTPTVGTRTEKIYTLGTTTKPVTPYGKTDLAPRILEIGTIDKVTNVFTATTTLHASDRIAVRFEVENLGTADSGHWQFNAVLPTFPNYIFESEGQQPLAPGDRIEYTIGFDSVEPDTNGRFVINVDPTSSIPEASESNNIATTTIRASSK